LDPNVGIDSAYSLTLANENIADYTQQHKLTFPDHNILQMRVNNYLTAYNGLTDLRERLSREPAKPDEEGFITVRRGPSKNISSQAAAEAAKQREEEKRKKRGELTDFYRFQGRERRKERERELRRQFEEDKKKVEKMKRARLE
jgi:ribosomal RNA-processing protein 7